MDFFDVYHSKFCKSSHKRTVCSFDQNISFRSTTQKNEANTYTNKKTSSYAN